ncbi:cation diffusion facilitator family transporter [Spirulina sp. CS-785/01]|uniref:cation diffusion facilitator family transporter n=1 Tax=Spirulina sp. CS-785/01 TaxID=3021716 RepID=UPI00232D136A|nr:cation diffusion facilitator family transporter [Spirulina sp. CS-785/01]MDB9311765.1 cation diffusion facilitator family transporter [Spirulina sp. CS-785/01]
MANPDSSKLSIYAAMAANMAIGVAKFIGAAISGSSAMLSEGIHSVVDSTNEILLLYGLKTSQASPDEEHPLGYGQELYFWSLIVAVLIFALGGGVSIYEGVRSLQHPEPSHDFIVSYVVLGVAAIFEGVALFVSIREFNKSREETELGFWQAILRSKDPSSFIVIFEDAAALIGLGVAFVGVLLTEFLENSLYDGIASMIIGVLLTVVAIVLVAETKGLLVGESASPETRESIKQIVQGDEAVTKMESPITFHLGPKDILLVLNIEFNDALSSDEIEAAVRRIEKNIRAEHDDIQRIFIEAASVN